MSTFSSYGVAHGNAKNWTGVILSPEDTAVLSRRGFGLHVPIAASGVVGPARTELVLSREPGADRLRRYDGASGKMIFSVALQAVRLCMASAARPLTRQDDICVNHLKIVERDGQLLLVSTESSVLRPCKKRNTARARQRSSTLHAAVPAAARGYATPTPSTAAPAPIDMPRQGLIVAWGESLGLRIPQDVAAQSGLADGTRVDINAEEDGRLIISRSRRPFTLDELLARMTPEREHRLEDDGPQGEEII